MTVREYIEKYKINKYTDITFVIAKAKKDDASPGYHQEYETTPIRRVCDFFESDIMNYYIVNDKQCPIAWKTSSFLNHFNKGWILSFLVISKEDIETLYSPKQAQALIKFIEEEINKENRKKAIKC